MSVEETADLNFMHAAVMEARKGLGHTRPNPPVGAVIVKDGRIIGKGYHHTCGCDHAEVDAIKNACRRKNDTTGATIYVTLEPCSKPGRVGACTDAIIAAGLARVVYGAVDPNPTNCGKAKRALARRGIACERLDPRSSQAALCRDLIRRFRKHVTTGLPYVTVKLAMSLDGKICDDDGDARWISSAAARKRTGALREQVDAIMVGGETVRRDNPSLLSHGKRNDDLVRVIVSKSGKLPKTAQVFTDGAPNKTLVFDDAKKAQDHFEFRPEQISPVIDEIYDAHCFVFGENKRTIGMRRRGRKLRSEFASVDERDCGLKLIASQVFVACDLEIIVERVA